VAATTRCASCGAPDHTAGTVCAACGAAPTGARSDDDRIGVPAGPPLAVIPDDLPPAREARRIQGMAVPLVAALVVVGIGWPLTALGVSQVGRLPSSEPPSSTETPGAAGRARLAGAVTFSGSATPAGCLAGGTPRIVTLGSGAEMYSILMSVPPNSPPGTYAVGAAGGTFVAVTRLGGGSQTWSSLGQAQARGTVAVGADRSVAARFAGLAPNGGGAEGMVEGAVEARCG